MLDRLNIAILGSGAMGSFFGALLAENQQDVTLLDIDDAHIEAINKTGIHLDLNGEKKTITALKAMRPEQLEIEPDLVIVFTKNYVTANALQSIKAKINKKCHLLGLQNGLGNDETLLKFAPAENIIIGMTTWPAAMPGPGQVTVDGEGLVCLQALDRKPSDFVTKLVKIMEKSGLNTQYDVNVWGSIWEKVAYNASMNAACALTGCTFGELKKIDEGRKLVHDTIKETLAVANKMGIQTDLKHCISLVDFGLDNHIHHKSSMLQDIEAGRKTEVMSINGKVAEYAAKYGVPAPINQTLTTLVRLKTE